MKKAGWIWAGLGSVAVGALLLIGVFLIYQNPEGVQLSKNEMVTVKWMIYGERYAESEEILEHFNRELHQYYPDISVELEVIPKGDYAKKWNLKMANGESVDLAWMGSDIQNFSEEVKKGSLMAIDYLLETYGKELREQIPEELWKKQQRDGNTYAIPVLGVLYRPNYVLTANKNLMERYGDFSEIIRVNQEANYTTRDCFAVMERFLEKVKKANALGKGVSYQSLCSIADKGYDGIYGQSCPFVFRIFDPEPVVYNKYELESWRACFETMASWYQKGYIREDVNYLLDPSGEDGKISGNILFVEEYGDKKTVYDAVDTEYEALRGELDGYRYISWETSRNCLVIPKTAKHPQEAMQVAALLNTEEGKELYRLLVNGIEKEQYVRMSENSDVIARMTDNDRNYRYGLPPETIGNMFQNYELTEGQFEQYRKYDQEALHSKLEGFELDTRMFAIEMARVELVEKQYLERLMQGAEPDWESVYEEFLEKMKEAGSVKIIREVQKQVDTYLRGKN